MHDIYFYKDRNGNEPVKEYLAELAAKKDKDSRIKLNKIRDYMKTLSVYGTQAGEPYIKHLDGEMVGGAGRNYDSVWVFLYSRTFTGTADHDA